MSAYAEASRAVFEVFADTTPLVEGLSIDEAFLDVGGLRRHSGTPTEIAVRLRRSVMERVGLPITVGVARTKFLAKVASAVAKPDGLLVVPPERELDFLHPLPVGRLWGVGPITAEKLGARGIHTVGEVALLAEPVLVSLLGRASGRHLHALAHNRDPRPVVVGRRRGSIGSQRALGRRPKTFTEVDASPRRSRRPGHPSPAQGRTHLPHPRAAPPVRRLRSRDPVAHPPAATASTPVVLAAARGLLAEARPIIEQRGITLVGIALANLDDDAALQLALPFDRAATGPLDHALDDVRERFGSASVTRAALIGRDPGITVPLLPD